MRALKFYQTGSLDDLHVEEVTVPIPAEGEVLVEVKAAAINPSDIKNVQGKMHETTVPRIPGRGFAGMIVKGQCPPGGQDMANRYRRSDASAPNPRHGRIEHRLQTSTHQAMRSSDALPDFSRITTIDKGKTRRRLRRRIRQLLANPQLRSRSA
jgi:Alcohol dehydrogenase GroES-like domain